MLEDPGAQENRSSRLQSRGIGWRTLAGPRCGRRGTLRRRLAGAAVAAGERAAVRKVDLHRRSRREPGRGPRLSGRIAVAFVAGGRLRVRRLDSLDAPSSPTTTMSLTFVVAGQSPAGLRPAGARLEGLDRRRTAHRARPVPADLVGSAGGIWTSDGQVVFAGSDTVGLWALPAAGGSGREILKIDRAAEADFHEIAALPDAVD